MARPSLPRDPDALASVVEAMIFASEEPVPPRTLLRLLYEDPAKRKKSAKGPGGAPLFEGEGKDEGAEPTRKKKGEMGQKELRDLVDGLNERYLESGRSFRIVEIAGGFQFATTREYGEYVGLMARDRARRRLSPASLETLSIIAYRQPVTKPEVEAIRGVNCDQVLVSLMERELITISGRAESVGRPLLYGTTDAFLRAFGLNSLSDLPKLRELEELMEEEAVSPSRPGAIPPEIAMALVESNPPTEEGREVFETEPALLVNDESQESEG